MHLLQSTQTMTKQKNISSNRTHKVRLLIVLLAFWFANIQAAKVKNTQSPQVKTTKNKASLPTDDSDTSSSSDNDDDQKETKSYARITPNILTTFNKCDQSTKQTVSTYSQAADWQEVQPGLNLIGLCSNPKCQTIKKKEEKKEQKIQEIISSPQGFGVFNIAKVTRKALCPACNNKSYKLKNVATCAFYRCEYIIEGEYKDKDGTTKSMEQPGKHTAWNDYFTFIGGQDNNRQYLWLEMTVKKL